jgi:hypothetical protein
MRKQRRKPGLLEREKIIGEAVKCVAAELRLVDLPILMRYVYLEQHANIADLIESSSELFFLERTLTYGSRADVCAKWGAAPSVVLDLEFAHVGVHAYFGLTLKAFNASVDLHAITFSEAASRTPAQNTQLLVDALEDARLPACRPLAAKGVVEELRESAEHSAS